VLIALVAALTLQVPAQSTASYTARASAPLLPSPAVTAMRADRSPALDGRLDDPVWALAPAVTADRAQVNAVHGDRAGIGPVETGQQLDEGRLSGPVEADDSEQFSRLDAGEK